MTNGKELFCCNQQAIYVDNVPGKEYYYCRTCKNEVAEPVKVEEVDLDAFDWSSFTLSTAMYATVYHPEGCNENCNCSRCMLKRS